MTASRPKLRYTTAIATLYVSVCPSFCVSFCLSATSELNISETRPDSRMVPMDSLYKLAYGLSIAHAPDDVTWLDAVIMVTSWFSFKMFLLVGIGRYFNSRFFYMVCHYRPHRCVDSGLMTSLMTSSYNNIVATLGLSTRSSSETKPDSGMVAIDSV